MRILASVSPGEIRVIACDSAGPLDYAIERPGAPDGVGDLHRGRILARMPVLAGAFVRIGDGIEGFLPDSAGGGQGEGTLLGVRITRSAQGGKGPRLTAALTAAEQALVGAGGPSLRARGAGAVARLAALHPQAQVLIDDPALAGGLRSLLGARLVVVARAFGDDDEALVAALGDADATLAGGVRMSVHPTPAVVAIDVDLAAGSAGRGGKTIQHEAANRAALPGLARQIRLRNLAGPIVIDLAGLSPRRRVGLGPALAEALRDDPLAPRFLGFSALGLAELLRPRVHPPLHELLAGPHAAGLAALRHAAHEAAADPAVPLALIAAPPVIAALEADGAALTTYAHRAGRPIVLRRTPGPALATWRVEAMAHG